ncbi:MAG: hypothetical protein ACR2LQ_09590 [Acidimicrobiales bacterium]
MKGSSLRYLLVAVTALALLAVASPARAGDPIATLQEKVQSGTARACRLTGLLPNGVCTLPTGVDVSDAAVLAYQKTWTHRALALQRALGDDQPLRNSDWPATHNSFNSAAYFPTLSGLDENQQVSMPAQLDLDMRAIEMDPHWFPSLEGGGYAPILCHGTGQVGCTIERLLSDGLTEVSGWLRAHPSQVILLDLDDALDVKEGYDAAAAALESTIGDLVYRPTADAGCQGLPLDVSRNDVRASGKQVVLMSSCGVGSSAWTNLTFSHEGREQYSNDGSFQPYPACDPQFDRAALQATFSRHWEDSTLVSALTGDANADSHIDARTVATMVACGIDTVGLDQLVPSDDRLGAFVWSWAPNEPATDAAGTCAHSGADGRFEAAPCAEQRQAACKAPAGSWVIPPTLAPAEMAQQLCELQGARYAVPRTGYDASLLTDAKAAAGVADVWLAYAVTDGTWRAA